MGIAALPTWAWVAPKTPMGKKQRDRDTGGSLSFPVRIDWEQNVIAVRRGESLQVPWSASGLGVQLAGTITVTASPEAYDDWDEGRHQHPDMPVDLHLPLLSYGLAMSRLNSLVELGSQANWGLMEHLRTYVEAVASKARRYVAAEISGETDALFVPQVLDDIGLEGVVDSLVYGRPGEPGSRVTRLIDRCMQPGTFRMVDPLRYVSIALRRDAEEEVRRVIGDPHIGPKVRHLYNTGRHASYADFVADYNRAYPSDDLGPARAAAAVGARLFPVGVAAPSELIENYADQAD